jgi:polyprenyl P-hydroxybenzoate/phenylacrylic acid decarboxylase-like protein
LNQNPEYVVGITGASGSVYGVRLVQELLKHSFNVSLIISEPGKLVLEHELGIVSPLVASKHSLQTNNSQTLNTCSKHPNLKIDEKLESRSKSSELCEFKTLIRGFGLKDGKIPNSDLTSAEEIDEPRRRNQALDGDLDGNTTRGNGRLRYYADDDLMAPICSGSHFTRGMIIVPCSMATLGSVANGISSSLIERTADVMLKESRELVLVPRETPLNRIHLKNMLALQEAGAKVVPAMPAFYHKPQTIEDMVDFVVGKVLDVLRVEHDLFERWSGEQ